MRKDRPPARIITTKPLKSDARLCMMPSRPGLRNSFMYRKYMQMKDPRWQGIYRRYKQPIPKWRGAKYNMSIIDEVQEMKPETVYCTNRDGFLISMDENEHWAIMPAPGHKFGEEILKHLDTFHKACDTGDGGVYKSFRNASESLCMTLFIEAMGAGVRLKTMHPDEWEEIILVVEWGFVMAGVMDNIMARYLFTEQTSEVDNAKREKK